MKDTTIYVIRHGETRWNQEGRWQGHEDSPLTPFGRKQASAAARFFSNNPFSIIYSSDLGRAHETARIISDKTGKKIIADPRLRERHLGIFQGLTGIELKNLYPDEYKAFKNFDPDYMIPNGESARQRYERSMHCLNEISLKHTGETIVVVCHGGVLDGLFRHVIGLPLEAPRKFRLWNAGINKFSFKDGQWELLTFGDVHHIEHADVLDDT